MTLTLTPSYLKTAAKQFIYLKKYIIITCHCEGSICRI